MELSNTLLSPSSKNKKIHSENISHILSKKAFVIFWETETPKKFLFQKAKLSYISGKGNPQKFLIFQEVTFRDRKIKKTLKNFFIFWKMKLSSPKTLDKTFLNFLAPNQKKLIKTFLKFIATKDFNRIVYTLNKIFYTLNKTPLEETGCLSSLYYLLNAQASRIHFQNCSLKKIHF